MGVICHEGAVGRYQADFRGKLVRYEQRLKRR